MNLAVSFRFVKTLITLSRIITVTFKGIELPPDCYRVLEQCHDAVLQTLQFVLIKDRVSVRNNGNRIVVLLDGTKVLEKA